VVECIQLHYGWMWMEIHWSQMNVEAV